MKIIECPRDALQGLDHFVPTQLKSKYINQLIKVGFDTIDFGSFVSSKAIPQMRDTAEVLANLAIVNSTKLLAIAVNLRGALEASSFDQITYIGYPLSVSETFQKRNANQTIAEALQMVEEFQEICVRHSKTLVVYISMGFGNPDGDPYSPEVVVELVEKLHRLQVKVISIADTTGVSSSESIGSLFRTLVAAYSHLEFGVHLHSRPDQSLEKIESAWNAGCRRFDGALGGYGGCPMADDHLVGNIDTGRILDLSMAHDIKLGYDWESLEAAKSMVSEIFLEASG